VEGRFGRNRQDAGEQPQAVQPLLGLCQMWREGRDEVSGSSTWKTRAVAVKSIISKLVQGAADLARCFQMTFYVFRQTIDLYATRYDNLRLHPDSRVWESKTSRETRSLQIKMSAAAAELADMLKLRKNLCAQYRYVCSPVTPPNLN
jgi:hypothetical protein